MERTWYDTKTGEYVDQRPYSLDYGDRHFERDGSLCSGMHKRSYQERSSPIKRV